MCIALRDRLGYCLSLPSKKVADGLLVWIISRGADTALLPFLRYLSTKAEEKKCPFSKCKRWSGRVGRAYDGVDMRVLVDKCAFNFEGGKLALCKLYRLALFLSLQTHKHSMLDGIPS